MLPESCFTRIFGLRGLPQCGHIFIDQKGFLFERSDHQKHKNHVIYVEWDTDISFVKFYLNSYRFSDESHQAWVDFIWLMARKIRNFRFEVSYLDNNFSVKIFEYGPVSLNEAVVFPDRLLSVGGLLPSDRTLLCSDVRLGKLFASDHRAFDKVLSAYALGIFDNDAKVEQLFEEYNRQPNMTLKMVRVDRNQISFERYSSKRAYGWDLDQDNKIRIGGLRAVPDTDLVGDLVAELSTVAATRQPAMNRVRGYILSDRGRRPCNYLRLLVPLEQRPGEQGASILVAALFPRYSINTPSAWVESVA
ncbi:MAG: hypothetical protein NXI19_04660 [Alphaproteobacteria bacterium]|nr:hypothetical protein [Alphaproteobacteria bacterium]